MEQHCTSCYLIMHTHGWADASFGEGNNEFSGQDKAIAKNAGVPAMLATPNGSVLLYSPKQEITFQLFERSLNGTEKSYQTGNNVFGGDTHVISSTVNKDGSITVTTGTTGSNIQHRTNLVWKAK